MIGLASTKTKEDLEDLIGKERFAQELRETVRQIDAIEALASARQARSGGSPIV